MTRVSGFTETRTRHVWEIPTDSTDASAVIGEFQDAYAMAAQKCEDLGIRSGSDDWLRIQPYGDTIRVWFETATKDPEPGPDRMLRFLDWVNSHEDLEVQEKITRLFVDFVESENKS